MADEYIKRDSTLNIIHRFRGYIDEDMEWRMKYAINKIPSADVAEVRHGEWIETIEHNGWVDETCAECSECGEDFILGEMDMDDIRNLFLYCPNCGARMDGGT